MTVAFTLHQQYHKNRNRVLRSQYLKKDLVKEGNWKDMGKHQHIGLWFAGFKHSWCWLYCFVSIDLENYYLSSCPSMMLLLLMLMPCLMALLITSSFPVVFITMAVTLEIVILHLTFHDQTFIFNLLLISHILSVLRQST